MIVFGMTNLSLIPNPRICTIARHRRVREEDNVPSGAARPGGQTGRNRHIAATLRRVTEQVSVTREIAAPAEQLWAMVSDVTRMSEWSPENEGGTWLGGTTSAQPGAKFRARNRIGRRRWSTVGTVVDAQPGHRFSFRVTSLGLRVSQWSYAFEPGSNGCRVTESWVDQRAGWFKPIARLATGVGDRATHNRAGMEQTLERLAAAAESSSASS
jgi:uncharacterized protein YndB with AHSA1/START domain